MFFFFFWTGLDSSFFWGSDSLVGDFPLVVGSSFIHSTWFSPLPDFAGLTSMGLYLCLGLQKES